jgi:adenosine deaminase
VADLARNGVCASFLDAADKHALLGDIDAVADQPEGGAADRPEDAAADTRG